MTEAETSPQPEGFDVYIITYDEEGNEVRLLPYEVTAEVLDRSRDLGINKGTWTIDRIKHGPFVAAESQLRQVNVGSLERAITGNYLGTALIVDRTPPPIDEHVWDVETRYDVDIWDGGIAAVVTQRFASQPAQTPREIAASLNRIAAAYECRIRDVVFALPGGGTPEELLAEWDGEDELSKQFRQETAERLALSAHDVRIFVTTESANTMATLMDGAAAIADFMAATKAGPLDAAGVLNLLRGGHFNVLIGEVESDYLEVKTQMHPIWAPGNTGKQAKVELAQDVARFANGNVDAILVVGYGESSGGSNEIASLTPITDSTLNVAQIQELLDARIVPPVDGLLIEKFPTSPMDSVLAIYVPRQAPEMQPYLVHGAIVEGKVEGAFFSIVRRRGEGSINTSAQQIHAYIVAGKRFLRGAD